MLAMSLDVILGYIGLASLGHAAYLGLGAYSVGDPGDAARGLLGHPRRRRALATRAAPSSASSPCAPPASTS